MQDNKDSPPRQNSTQLLHVLALGAEPDAGIILHAMLHYFYVYHFKSTPPAGLNRHLRCFGFPGVLTPTDLPSALQAGADAGRRPARSAAG